MVKKKYALKSIIFRIVATLMAEKDKENIVGEWINSGRIFLLKDKLLDGFKKSLNI